MRKKLLFCFCYFFIKSHFFFKFNSKRFLVYPPSSPTRYQFIAGYGIPAELPDYQSLITGYVLKAMFYLPSNASQLRVINSSGNKIIGNIPIEPINHHIVRKASIGRKLITEKKNINLGLRWTIYTILHIFFERIGFDGEACLLRSICEIASIPFHSYTGLMGEILHIIMSPSTSYDMVDNYKQQQFFKAEILGKKGTNCEVVFRECTSSVFEKFSFIKPISNFLG